MTAKNHDMKNKAVSFNLLDPDQKKQYEHAMKRKNFSAYVKRLIQRDIDNAFAPKAVQQKSIQKSSPAPKLNEDLMNNLI